MKDYERDLVKARARLATTEVDVMGGRMIREIDDRSKKHRISVPYVTGIP